MSQLEQEMFDRQQEIQLEKFKYAIVIGVGGIGSWVALNIALTGRVSTLFLIDPDKIENSNLNRTPFRFCDIGQYKVDALKFLILERRAMEIETYQQKTDATLFETIAYKTYKYEGWHSDVKHFIYNGVIIDCRDDVYTDFYQFPYKYYKVGYDGLSVTIDGNPRNTAVWGRSNSYRFTPSFICPSQLAANLVVTDIMTTKINESERDEDGTARDNVNPFDNEGRLNKAVTFNVHELLELIHREVNVAPTPQGNG